MKVYPIEPGRFSESSGYRTADRPNHRGTDFAADYGVPVRAAAAGKVVKVGLNDDPNGFGSWVVIDHQPELGVDTVYGHMPPSSITVRVGDSVAAGQQIAQVGSEGASSGPHLHFEVWGSPGRFGGQDRDPMAWLADANDTPDGDISVTFYGIDISSFQEDIDLAEVEREGFSFVLIKATQGNWYRNPWFDTQFSAAKATGLLIGVYHYIEDSPARGQVDKFEAVFSDKKFPVMLDHELDSGNVQVLRDVHAEFVKRGWKVNLTYLPQWYWRDHIGSPSIAGLPPLMASSYVNGSGFASNLYPGNDNYRWNGYGGNEVAVLQFTDKAQVAGQSVDGDAFRGSREELEALFTVGPVTPPPPPPPSLEDKVNDLLKRVKAIEEKLK